MMTSVYYRIVHNILVRPTHLISQSDNRLSYLVEVRVLLRIVFEHTPWYNYITIYIPASLVLDNLSSRGLLVTTPYNYIGLYVSSRQEIHAYYRLQQ